jgi:cytosine/adenosine deaminase-related metal-dependent hydrolase
MRLNNLIFPGGNASIDLLMEKDRIREVHEYQPGATQPKPAANPPHPAIDFEGALVFPGLINSHDHLDFNLFPLLGNRVYKNYTEWGPDILGNNSEAIKAVLRVPQQLRTQWGIYKNLLNGYTTVVNHGERLPVENSPINVFQECRCLHSVGFERYWRWKLNRPGTGGRPIVLHVGEGTDDAATREIDQLIRWNIFHRPLIGIHGVAMTERQAARFHALVWCPVSNEFLLGKTAAIDRLKGKVPVLFGTDSTLTAGWNHWEQVRAGRRLQLAEDRELLGMLTTAPATAWGLKDRGALAPGRIADLVIARPPAGRTGMDAFFSLDPKDILLVIHEGNIRLFDPTLRERLTAGHLSSGTFEPTRPGGKYVWGDLPGLMREIRQYCPTIDFPPVP